ncbi:MAG: aminotransferase class I/II-fold pyridoxal phosphate-dependent enzyme [Propionibacteriaceae bacterium]|jgi:histidinol-phosphate/aromatic aminotransferase/cobyric acid decarboxylase-like protein/choline kinase|nr:aminotransferase class I/II-fold pyridoxal phosphate-dependent enzyme [Propionibacteriaceae bacterium]
MQAVILAAGMGTRLGALTAENTKCMVPVNGVTLISRMLGQLDRVGLSRIVLVVGYAAEKLVKYIATLDVATPIEFVENPIYDQTNNIYSLWLARSRLVEDDTLLLESDLIFEDSVLESLLTDERASLALVDKYESWMDGTVVTLKVDDTISDFIDKQHFSFAGISSYYKTVNIYKFGKGFSASVYVPFLEAYIKAWGANAYYEQVLRVIAMVSQPQIQAKRLAGQLWYEIDDIQDLDIAESMFQPSAGERLEAIGKRYGGYWRYPKLTDFCYLVNPFFPPRTLIDELQASFTTLLTQYPSGMGVNALLAAKNFDIPVDSVVVGNGAAELIRPMMEKVVGRVGVVRPTFEEYPNSLPEKAEITFVPTTPGFSYTADDIMRFFDDKPISTLVVVNPDNPTGNYIPRADVVRLAAWAETRGVRLVMDESFVDFADEVDATLLTRDFLAEYPHVVVVKSISKSYGVPGLRLGVAVSGDADYVAALRQDVAIWNINSFAEFYLQIEGKYAKEYAAGMDLFREARALFMTVLEDVPHIVVFPSQANFVMIELVDCPLTVATLAGRLLERHNLLVKDLSEKLGKLGDSVQGRQFMRVAIRRPEDNQRLVDALREELA